MYYSDFSYVDITRVDKDGINQKWNRVHISELDKWRQKMIALGSKHCFSTIQRFANEVHTEGEEYISDMYFDLDSDDVIFKALVDARKLKDFLVTGVGAEDEDCKVFFSGNRGFHFEISAEFVGIQPSVNLCKVLHHIAEFVGDKLSLKTLDRTVYSKRRMWRMTNTRHGKSGLWKVPFTLAEIGSFDVDRITELAVSRRTIEVDV